MASTILTSQEVRHIATLARIPVTPDEESSLAKGFNTVIRVVEKLFSLNLKNVPQTHQVIGLENVFREDEVDELRMFSQKQALANAKRTFNGYFMVDQVIEQE